MYDAQLSRLSNRPGGKIQDYLAKRNLQPILRVSPLTPSSQFAEIGPGVGRIADLVSRTQSLYTGFEPTDSLRNHLMNLEFVKNNKRIQISKVGLPDVSINFQSTFTHIYAFHVIEHAPNQYVAHLWLEDIYTALQSGGFALISCPDYLDYKGVFYDVDWSHGFSTTRNNLVGILKDTNFKIVSAQYTRGTASNIFLRAMLAVCSRIYPRITLDRLFEKMTGFQMLGTGILAGLFKRNIIIVVQKCD